MWRDWKTKVKVKVGNDKQNCGEEDKRGEKEDNRGEDKRG